MAGKGLKMIAMTICSVSLIMLASDAVAANVNLKPEETIVIEAVPIAAIGEWELLLEGGQATYTKTLSIAKGSGNLKLDANNSGSQSLRVTLQSIDYPQYGVILDTIVKPGESFDWIKNGGGVPSGAYILQVHGSAANPKGAVNLKSAAKPW